MSSKSPAHIESNRSHLVFPSHGLELASLPNPEANKEKSKASRGGSQSLVDFKGLVQ